MPLPHFLEVTALYALFRGAIIFDDACLWLPIGERIRDPGYPRHQTSTGDWYHSIAAK